VADETDVGVNVISFFFLVNVKRLFGDELSNRKTCRFINMSRIDDVYNDSFEFYQRIPTTCWHEATDDHTIMFEYENNNVQYIYADLRLYYMEVTQPKLTKLNLKKKLIIYSLRKTSNKFFFRKKRKFNHFS